MEETKIAKRKKKNASRSCWSPTYPWRERSKKRGNRALALQRSKGEFHFKLKKTYIGKEKRKRGGRKKREKSKTLKEEGLVYTSAPYNRQKKTTRSKRKTEAKGDERKRKSRCP